MPNQDDIYTIRELLLQWMSGEEMDEADWSLLKKWADAVPENQLLMEQLKDNCWIAEQLEKLDGVDTEEKWQSFAGHLHRKGTGGLLVRMKRWTPGRVAVVLVVCVGLGITGKKWWTSTHQPVVVLADQQLLSAGAVATKVTLTLVDGSVIELDKSPDKQVAKQGNTRVMQRDSDRLTYLITKDTEEQNGGYNTLTVPSGMQFQLVLADGTEVWLNTSSSLRYPVVFAGKDREVELRGEAYFKVAPNAALPFKVTTPEITTDVLGTDFNVRDYPNEHSPRTTLLGGKVTVSKGDEMILLTAAGQEVQAGEGEPVLRKSFVDPESRVAWKNGYFYFDPSDIRTSMGEVARWYKMELQFRGGAEKAQMGGGSVKRDKPLPELLKRLERTDLHFQVMDNVLIVSR